MYPVHVGEPSTFDCHAAASPNVMWRVAPHYSSLLRIDPDKYPEVEGDLAASWKVSPDGLNYEFKLRPNVKFHDGSALTATDVKVSYDRMRAPPTGVVSLRKGMLEDIKSIDAPSASTVIFRLSQPNAAMLQLLAMPYACVYSAKLLAEDPSYPAKKVMGSGPFRFARYQPGAEWVGERFDGYFDTPKPYLDGFRALSVSATATINSVVAGQVSYSLRGLTENEVERVKAARGDKVNIVGRTMSTGVHTWIAVNTQKPPLNDVRVRRALLLAMDRWSGSKAMEQLTALHVMGGMLRPGSPFARSAAELESLPGFGHDITASRAEARRLLAEAGHPNLKLTFLNRQEYPFFGVYLADQLRQIGVSVDHQMGAAPQVIPRKASGDYDLVLDSPPEYLDDPTVQLSVFLPHRNNPTNFSRSNDEKLSALFQAQKSALDPKVRRERVRELESHILDQAYVLPLYWQNWTRAISTEVRGVGELPSNFLKIDLADVWLTPAGKK